MLRMNFTLVRNIKAIRLLQWALFVWVHIHMALDTFLSHVSPAVSWHPFSFTLRTFVLPKASFLALVWCQAFTFGTCLRTIFDIMSFREAEVTKISRRRSLAWFTFQGERQVIKMVGKVVDTTVRWRRCLEWVRCKIVDCIWRPWIWLSMKLQQRRNCVHCVDGLGVRTWPRITIQWRVINVCLSVSKGHVHPV